MGLFWLKLFLCHKWIQTGAGKSDLPVPGKMKYSQSTVEYWTMPCTVNLVVWENTTQQLPSPQWERVGGSASRTTSLNFHLPYIMMPCLMMPPSWFLAFLEESLLRTFHSFWLWVRTFHWVTFPTIWVSMCQDSSSSGALHGFFLPGLFASCQRPLYWRCGSWLVREKPKGKMGREDGASGIPVWNAPVSGTWVDINIHVLSVLMTISANYFKIPSYQEQTVLIHPRIFKY